MGVRIDDLFSTTNEWPSSATEGPGAARAWPGHGGVYLLTDGEDRLVQLAAAADLRRALSVRLCPPKPGESPVGEAAPAGRPRADLSQIVRRVRWRRADSMFEITWEYYRLARLLMPETYLRQVGFGPCWFVHVDPAAEHPRFSAGKHLRGPPGAELGPFATQADAARFIEILEDAFDLCRYHHVLVQAPHGRPCAYLDMGKCPAPCDGRVPMAAYREMIASALAFAAGRRGPAFEQWESAMRQAADQRAYERAAAIRQTLERARRIEHEVFRLVVPIERFNYLIVQRGPGPTRVRPFFIRGGLIEAGEATRLKEAPHAAGGWIERLRSAGADHAAADPIARSEQLWLVSHFLFKRDPPGLYWREDALGAAGDLAGRIQAHFAARPGEELKDIGETAQ
ncbi:MAG: hypothetical protein AMXMBFR83_03250 [Phycisphaerae bacterium]